MTKTTTRFCIVVPTPGTSMFSYFHGWMPDRDEPALVAWRIHALVFEKAAEASEVAAYLNDRLRRKDIYVAEWY